MEIAMFEIIGLYILIRALARLYNIIESKWLGIPSGHTNYHDEGVNHDKH